MLGNCTSSCGLKRILLLSLITGLFLLPQLSISKITQAQGGGGLDDTEAQRHLELGQIYELAGEWNLALEAYRIAAQAESESLALEAREGINRVLSYKNSFWSQVKNDLIKFLTWATSSLVKLLISAVALLLLGKCALLLVDRDRASWTVMPFFDLTNNKWGEAVSESIVRLMHEARLVHLNTSTGILNVSEEIDLPSFRAPSCTRALTSSLKALDSLDVSGVGLPMGSALAAAVRWLDMGQRHITGSIQRQGHNLCLSAQLRKGRTSGSSEVWTVYRSISQDGLESTLFQLERDLAFQILHDTQEGWGASTPKSLTLFTEALQNLHSFQAHPTMQEKALHDATMLLEEALRVDPTYVAAKYNLAIVSHNLGKHRKAIEILKSLRLHPNHGLDLEIAYNLGAAYYHSLGYWTYDYAEQEFHRVVEGLEESKLAESRRELCALAHCGLTSTYAQKMHHDADNSEDYFLLATEHYTKALNVSCESPQIAAIAHTAMGMALLNHDQAQEATAEFEKAVRLKPDYWRAYIHWGRAEIMRKDFERAVLCLKQAVALNPSYEFAQYKLGAAFKRLKKFDEAAEAFARAPNIAQALDERGSILAEYHQEYEAALKEFEQALAIQPNLSNALVNIAWYTLEADYQDKEHLGRALEYARRAVELDRDSPNAWHRYSVLGRVYLACNQLTDAKLTLEKAIQLNREAPQSYFFLAKVFVHLEELEKAKESLAEFLKRPRKSPWHKRTREVAITLMNEINEQLKTGH